jgi:hypothetical protein
MRVAVMNSSINLEIMPLIGILWIIASRDCITADQTIVDRPQQKLSPRTGIFGTSDKT